MNSRLAALLRVLFLSFWVANGAIWIGLVAWVATQPDALRDLESIQLLAISMASSDVAQSTEMIKKWIGLVLIAAAITGMAMLFSVIAGTRGFRTVRVWMLLIVAACGWLTLGLGIRDLHWHGQQYRTMRHLQELNEFASSLNDQWPTQDGDLEFVGPYLAYPKSKPTTLLFVGSPAMPGTELKLTAIERTADGILRFELAGGEQPSWLVWQTSNAMPGDFTSGLATRYQVDRSAQLARNWYLVHYQVDR